MEKGKLPITENDSTGSTGYVSNTNDGSGWSIPDLFAQNPGTPEALSLLPNSLFSSAKEQRAFEARERYNKRQVRLSGLESEETQHLAIEHAYNSYARAKAGVFNESDNFPVEVVNPRAICNDEGKSHFIHASASVLEDYAFSSDPISNTRDDGPPDLNEPITEQENSPEMSQSGAELDDDHEDTEWTAQASGQIGSVESSHLSQTDDEDMMGYEPNVNKQPLVNQSSDSKEVRSGISNGDSQDHEEIKLEYISEDSEGYEETEDQDENLKEEEFEPETEDDDDEDYDDDGDQGRTPRILPTVLQQTAPSRFYNGTQPIPSNVQTAVANINSVKKGPYGYPQRTAIVRHPALGGFINRDGALRRSGPLMPFFGDLRLFTEKEWRFLEHRDVGVGANL